jgi:hypothetical protein
VDTTLGDKVCQLLATGQWFSPGTPVSSTNKTDCQDITEILLKVVLNTTKYLYIVRPVSRGHHWDKRKSGLIRQVTS